MGWYSLPSHYYDPSFPSHLMTAKELDSLHPYQERGTELGAIGAEHAFGIIASVGVWE